MNQLQKDIEIALSWFSFIPENKKYNQDIEAFKRLEWYIKQEVD